VVAALNLNELGKKEWDALQAAAGSTDAEIELAFSDWLLAIGWQKKKIKRAMKNLSVATFEQLVDALTKAGCSSHEICKVMDGFPE
jgi:hypothetical protein